MRSMTCIIECTYTFIYKKKCILQLNMFKIPPPPRILTMKRFPKVNNNYVRLLSIICVLFLTMLFYVVFNEKEMAQKADQITGGSILLPTVLLLFIFMYYDKEKNISNSKLVLYFAILGYVLDWLSLTNDITRFSDEREYNDNGKKASFITKKSGRVNSTITGTGAMLADVYALYQSSKDYYDKTELFETPFVRPSKDYYKKPEPFQTPFIGPLLPREKMLGRGYFGKMATSTTDYYMLCVAIMTLCHFVWCSYLTYKYDRKNELLIMLTTIQLLLFGLLVMLYRRALNFKTKTKQLMGVHVLLAISGFISVFVLNRTESNLNLDTTKKNTIPRFFYGSNKIRGLMNSLVIFANIFLGYQNSATQWREVKDKSVVVRTLKMGLSFLTDQMVPSMLNFFNTSYQLKLKSSDLGIPKIYDGGSENSNLYSIILIILITIFISYLLYNDVVV